MEVVKKKTADFVVEEIKRMIGSGEIKLGQKLPNQHEFSSKLGVSRTSLREAFSTLARLGVIEQRPRAGTIVKSSVQSCYSDYLTPPLISDRETTLELIEARRYIELAVVELAVEKATDAEIKDLEDLISGMKKALREKSLPDYIECDTLMHFGIAKATHNRFLIHIYSNMMGTLGQYIRESFNIFSSMLDETLKCHEEIVTAIKARNTAKAKRKMAKHISQAQSAVSDYYTALSDKRE